MTRNNPRTARGVLFACLALVLLMSVGCGNDRTDNNANVLRIGLAGDPEGLDPQRFVSTQAGNVLRDLGEGLVRYAADGSIEPGLASDWDISSDGLQYTFHLRDGLKWSDGTDLTSVDFLYSYHRLFDPSQASASADKLLLIENADAAIAGDVPPEQIGVDAPDTRTLIIRIQSPTPYFLQLLAHPAAHPVHRPSIEEHGDYHVRPGNLVSSGAYRLTDWQASSKIELARNPYYWDNSNTSFDIVQYHINENMSAQVNRYRAGELDITSGINSELFEILKKERPNEVKVGPTLATYYYGFNLTAAPFKNSPKLRKALSLALDREAIVRAVTRRGEQEAYSLVPPGVTNYEPSMLNYAHMSKEEREAEARRLYSEAGFGPDNPAEFDIRYNTAEVHQTIAVAVQAMWRSVLEAEVTLVNEEFKVFLSNVRDMKQTQVFRLSWTGDYNDPYTFLQLFRTDNENNLTAYSNAEVDALLKKSDTESDMVKRRAYLEQAEAIALSDHPLIPIYYFVSKHLVNERIDGWEPNILDYRLSRHFRLRDEEGSENTH